MDANKVLLISSSRTALSPIMAKDYEVRFERNNNGKVYVGSLPPMWGEVVVKRQNRGGSQWPTDFFSRLLIQVALSYIG
jgi:hypothetical protein